MRTDEIRKKFLDFFASKGHKIIPSDTLVPKEDPTVLFTTAGMQQFKRQFLGQIEGFTKAATSQKCLRTDDLDKVGKTAFHHTFFEMLGNFSFGDYFKKDAIEWAWEFLTKQLHIPEEKLWVSVYHEDTEAEEIWLKKVKIPQTRLVRLGDKSNFWPSEAKTKGPNGPCGPCSEIFFDYGTNPNCHNPQCNPDCDCGRFAEIWNLVFTQFNRKDGGVLEPLPNKNIDTGMGLERLAAVIQGKKTNFDTDLFALIFANLEEELNAHKIRLEQKEKCVIVDHVRAIVFAICDGVIPSNKERGSVIKRLIYDSTNLMLSHGAQNPSIYKLVNSLVEAMKHPYPELMSKAKNIADIIQRTEEAFVRVRQQRIPELKDLLRKLKTSEKRGNAYFMYRDTYGLPVSTILETAKSAGISQADMDEDMVVFHQQMQKQKDQSRAKSKMSGDVFTATELKLNVPKTQFAGYEGCENTSKILKLYVDNIEVAQAEEGDMVKVILDKTPLYAESGGQIGDTGTITTTKGLIRIHDTKKISDIFIHEGVVEQGLFQLNDSITVKVDMTRRLAIMRNHTATHLLQSALRQVLGAHVQQQGSLVTQERLRFDFVHPKAVSPEELEKIESSVNQWILAGDSIKKETLSINEARQKGALAFFAEKYGELVRVVSINEYSKELCGGTHLESTSQIGLFKILGESAIAQGIRRIEAVTGTYALDSVKESEKQLKQISQILKAPAEDLSDRIQAQCERVKQLEKDVERFRLEAFHSSIDQIIKKSEEINGAQIIEHIFKETEVQILRKLNDLIKQKVPSGITLLGSNFQQNVFLLISVTDNLVKKGIKANEIVKEAIVLLDGNGGGNPQLAQAGGKDITKLQKTLHELKTRLKERLLK